ncbi:MAG: hypothetical protein P1U42_03620, partial [Phycisphaerales bacterium]|nr:hypothetical protein [Phycisphaerales bacterium]
FLAKYLNSTRQWTGPLIDLRNEIEHHGWMLQRIDYSVLGDAVVARQPEIDGVPLTEYLEVGLNRLASLVEEMTAYVLSCRMPPMIQLSVTAVDRRSATCPERFQVILANRGAEPWILSYSDLPFDNR